MKIRNTAKLAVTAAITIAVLITACTPSTEPSNTATPRNNANPTIVEATTEASSLEATTAATTAATAAAAAATAAAAALQITVLAEAMTTPMPANEPRPTMPAEPLPMPTAVTYLPSQSPTATPNTNMTATAIPTTKLADSFLMSLSPEERHCLPLEVNSDAMLYELIGLIGSFTDEYADCLTEDNQFNIYLHLVTADENPTANISVATHRCVWAGVKPLFSYVPAEDADSAELINIMAAALIAPIAVLSYCISEEELNQLNENNPNRTEDIRENRYLKCIVEHQGGTQEFVQYLMDNPEIIGDDLNITAPKCDEIMSPSEPSNTNTTTP